MCSSLSCPAALPLLLRPGIPLERGFISVVAWDVPPCGLVSGMPLVLVFRCGLVPNHAAPCQEGKRWVKDMFDRIESGMLHSVDVCRSVYDAMVEEHERFVRLRNETGF